MRLSAAPFAVLALSVSAAGRGLAQTPCDVLPTMGSRVETVKKQGAAFPKPPTGCPPGTKDEGNVCRGPDFTEPRTVQTNPRDDCERGLKVSITRVKDFNGQTLANSTVYKPGPVKLLLEGDGAANGVFASMGGGIAVSVGDAARRLGATLNATCLPPNCQVVVLENLANAPNGLHTLTLKTPHGYASASVGLYVDPAPVPIVLGDIECEQPAKTVWAEMQLAATSVGPGQTVSSNRVLVTLPPLASRPGQPAQPRKWTLTVHQSDLESVTPTTFTAPGPVTFSYTARPAPPPSAPPAAPPGSMYKVITDRGPQTRRCVWARLTTNEGSVVVATPVHVTP